VKQHIVKLISASLLVGYIRFAFESNFGQIVGGLYSVVETPGETTGKNGTRKLKKLQ
jgi:hypothetical protein